MKSCDTGTVASGRIPPDSGGTQCVASTIQPRGNAFAAQLAATGAGGTAPPANPGGVHAVSEIRELLLPAWEGAVLALDPSSARASAQAVVADPRLARTAPDAPDTASLETLVREASATMSVARFGDEVVYAGALAMSPSEFGIAVDAARVVELLQAQQRSRSLAERVARAAESGDADAVSATLGELKGVGCRDWPSDSCSRCVRRWKIWSGCTRRCRG